MLKQKHTTRRLERKQKNTQKIFRRVFGVIIIAVLFSGIFYLLFFCKYVKIKSIAVKGSGAAIEAQVSEAAREVLENKVFKILPSDSLILFNKKKVSKEISEKCALNAISITRKLPSSLEIQIEERTGVLNWCDGDDCYLIDKDAAEASKDLDSSLPVVSESCTETDRKHNKGKVDFVSSANGLILDKLGLRIKSFSLENCFTQKLVAKTDVGFEVYFNLARPVKEQTDVLYNVLTEKILEKNWATIQYVDLQVEGRVYYK